MSNSNRLEELLGMVLEEVQVEVGDVVEEKGRRKREGMWS